MNENEENAKVMRINELAHKAKTEGLTKEEEEERHVLRKEYIESFKRNMRSQVEKIVFVEKDGTHTPVKKKNK